MKPVAWLHEKQPTAYVITARVKQLWIDSGNPEHVEHYTIPLYFAEGWELQNRERQ